MRVSLSGVILLLLLLLGGLAADSTSSVVLPPPAAPGPEDRDAVARVIPPRLETTPRPGASPEEALRPVVPARTTVVRTFSGTVRDHRGDPVAEFSLTPGWAVFT